MTLKEFIKDIEGELRQSKAVQSRIQQLIQSDLTSFREDERLGDQLDVVVAQYIALVTVYKVAKAIEAAPEIPELTETEKKQRKAIEEYLKKKASDYTDGRSALNATIGVVSGLTVVASEIEARLPQPEEPENGEGEG